MAADGLDIGAVLAGWRATGADRLDPLRFHRIAALHRRAAARDGVARCALEATLAGLVGTYARDVECRPHTAMQATPAPGALGRLVDDMSARARSANPGAAAAYPELPAVDDLRALWSSLRTEREVRRSLAEAPTGAGPLNSAALAHRSLRLMGRLSPGYVRQFLAYVDTLSWLHTLQDAGVLTGPGAAPSASAKPRARARTRKRV